MRDHARPIRASESRRRYWNTSTLISSSPRVSRRSHRPHPRRCARNRECRRRDSAAPASANAGQRGDRALDFRDAARCPTSYCGIDSGHRLTSATKPAPRSRRADRGTRSRTAAIISSSSSAIISRCISPPTNARARICAGRRASFELQAREAAGDYSADARLMARRSRTLAAAAEIALAIGEIDRRRRRIADRRRASSRSRRRDASPQSAMPRYAGAAQITASASIESAAREREPPRVAVSRHRDDLRALANRSAEAQR